MVDFAARCWTNLGASKWNVRATNYPCGGCSSPQLSSGPFAQPKPAHEGNNNEQKNNSSRSCLLCSSPLFPVFKRLLKLNATVFWPDDSFFSITNRENTYLTNIKISINREYFCRNAPSRLEPGESIDVFTQDCVNSDNLRFDRTKYAIEKIQIIASIGDSQKLGMGEMTRKGSHDEQQ